MLSADDGFYPKDAIARVKPIVAGDRISFVLNNGEIITGVATKVDEREDGSLEMTFEQYPDLSRTVGYIDAATGALFELDE